MAAFQPADNLRSRTFIGLLIAQFLAAFNDQAIHASAMFFAINTNTMNEGQAISLMPILFYAPWAIFCTLAGWFADRFSKRNSLVFWKVAEVLITLVALAGFWLGGHKNPIGAYIVLSTVFLMGMHSAFFVPAKYGIMPEILTPHMLSRGNGLLESLSFLAVILGTVSGGVLSYLFSHVYPGNEYWIGLILVTLAVIGAAASLLIRRVPAANPTRPFPPFLYQPLWRNIRDLLRSRPLALAVIGIAFFTFVVAFMRATVYMLGEVQAPRWEEWQTSVVVGMVALGIGFGSPLAGFLSGGKVELGLVPLGALAMVLLAAACALPLDPDASLLFNFNSAASFDHLAVLIGCIILLGFFTGFYIVPLFTLLQHRAPKISKGDFIATSNFLSVTGAILASAVFYLMDYGAEYTHLAPNLDQTEVKRADGGVVGTLTEDPEFSHGRLSRIVIDDKSLPPPGAEGTDVLGIQPDPFHLRFIRERLKKGDQVVESTYQFAGVTHHRVRRAEDPMNPAYDKRGLPRLLFLSAAAMTLLTFLLLRSQLPDLTLRSFLWLRRLRRHGLEVDGMHNLPAEGPVVVATNAADLDGCLSVLSATDRMTRFLLVQGAEEKGLGGITGWLARRNSLTVLPGKATNWDKVAARVAKTLDRKDGVGVPLGASYPAGWLERLIEDAAKRGAGVLPVRVEVKRKPGGKRRTFYLIVGELLPAGTGLDAVRRELERLGETFRAQDEKGLEKRGAAATAH